jgi:hypothetical protein
MSAPAATRTWSNASGGSWHTPANWAEGFVPTASDTVLITAAGTYAVTVTADAEFGSLTVGGGTGTQTLQWQSGSLAGALTVASGGVLDFGNNASKTFNGGSITNHGTVVWPSSGPIFWYFNSSHFENAAGGLVDLQRDGLFIENAGEFSFRNAGTLRKSGGTGASGFSAGVAVTNVGTVQVQSGTLNFPGGFTSSSTFDVSAGARIELENGTFNFLTGHTFTGNGFYGVASGSPVINGPIINTNFTLAGGTLSITNQLTGTLYWQGGSLAGNLIVATNGVLDFGTNSSKTFNGGSITNFGTVVWPSSGPIFWYFNSAHFENAAGGLVDLQRDGLFIENAGEFSFRNAGTLRKSGGTGASGFSAGVAVTNVGTVQVQSGTLNFPGGFTSSSTFDVSAGARIELENGTFNFLTGHTFTGNGFYGVSAGSPVINGPIINTNFTLAGGTLNITNQLTGALYWQGGNLAGDLLIATNAVLDFGGNASKTFNGGTITNHGTVVWPSSGPIFWYFNTGHFENAAGGLVDMQRDGLFIENVPEFSFRNAGTLRKSGGTGAGGFNVGVAVTNVGTIEALSGDLDFPAGYAMTAGLLRFGISGNSTFGRITYTGTAPLVGGVGAMLLNSFVPNTNVSFPVMTFGSSSGTFTETNGLRVGSGRAFSPVYGGTTFSLLSVLATDVTITNQPQSTTVIAGNNAQFTVGASSDETITYQWRFNGTPIGSSNTNRYTVVNAQPANSGNYDVVLTTASTTVTSLVATLTVHVPPSFTATPVSLTVASGQNATFTASASGIPSPTYQWLFNGTPIPGATSSTLTVAGASTNVGAFSVVISNAAGSVTNTVSLTLVDLKFFAGVVIDAALSSQFRVEFTTDVNTPTTNWTTLSTVVVTNRPHIVYDANSPGLPRRFYRAVPLP